MKSMAHEGDFDSGLLRGIVDIGYLSGNSTDCSLVLG